MNQLVSVTATFSVSGSCLWNSLPFNVRWWDLTVLQFCVGCHGRIYTSFRRIVRAPAT